MQRLTEEEKRTLWVGCLSVGYASLTILSNFAHPVWQYPGRTLELSLTAGLSTYALVTLLRDFWPKTGTLEVINVSPHDEAAKEHERRNRYAIRIPIFDLSLRKAFPFCLDHSGSIRILMFILVMFLLIGTIFDRHGHLVIENQYFQTSMNYLHNLSIGFVLFRLIKPKNTQDLLALAVAVFTTIFGHLYFALQSILLYILVLFTRWWRTPRLVGVLIYTIFVTPIILTAVACVHVEGPSPIFPPEQLRTMDGIYHLAKSYEGVTLYREVQLFPGVYLRKNLDYKQTGWPSYANIQKVADGKYEITTGEPPPEYFK